MILFLLFRFWCFTVSLMITITVTTTTMVWSWPWACLVLSYREPQLYLTVVVVARSMSSSGFVLMLLHPSIHLSPILYILQCILPAIHPCSTLLLFLRFASSIGKSRTWSPLKHISRDLNIHVITLFICENVPLFEYDRSLGPDLIG